MPGKVAKIGTFSDWVGLFDDWRKEIGVNHDEIASFKFDTLYGAIYTEEIEFGSYKGRRKWENLRQVPTQQMRDALINMIVYQGDTEFASVEQQRYLFESAPTDWDRRAITRVMIEEMRHGWQMCALLVDHFGYSGKVEAQKMLERRAFENKRLLGAFNVDVDNWMDFFTYTDFVDRDGKFQLQMLKYSGYAPLGAVMARPEIADLFVGDEGDKFMHGITFGGHPASCAAAVANIEIIEREGLAERARVMGDYMMRELRAAVGEHPNVGDIRGMGLFLALELVRDQASKQPLEEPNLMAWLSDQFKRRGLICRADDRLDPVIQLAPPLNIPQEDADQVVVIVADVIQALGRKMGTQPTMEAVRFPQAVAV
jgi:hypothetical protein